MKRIVSIVLAVLSVFLLVACQKNEPVTAQIVEYELTSEQYAFGVDKTQPKLLETVNTFIGEIKEDGTLDEIFERYFSGGEPKTIVSEKLDPSKDQLVVATNAAFAPFEYMSGNKYHGIDMEIAALLAEELGQDLVIQNMDFESVCLSVGLQKCDIAMAGLTVDADREQYVTFSESYYEASQSLVVRSNDTTFADCKSKEDVEKILKATGTDDKIGAQAGTTAQFYIEGDEDKGFTGVPATCVLYKSASLAIQDMLNENVQYVITDTAPAQVITTEMNEMGSFGKKVERFKEVFGEENGYERVLTGLKNTLLIAVSGLLIGIVIGLLIATVRVLPKYKLTPRILEGICELYVSAFRGTPMVVQLLVFYYVLFPLIGIKITGVEVSILVFGLNSGAYISEIMRSGIQSVDRGQMEAGRAVGLSFATTMIRIVIPQAIKNILPTLGNEFISLIKETSIVSFVGATDLYVAFNYIGTNSYEFMVPYLVMAMIYIVLILVISLGIKWMERSLKKSDRRN